MAFVRPRPHPHPTETSSYMSFSSYRTSSVHSPNSCPQPPKTVLSPMALQALSIPTPTNEPISPLSSPTLPPTSGQPHEHTLVAKPPSIVPSLKSMRHIGTRLREKAYTTITTSSKAQPPTKEATSPDSASGPSANSESRNPVDGSHTLNEKTYSTPSSQLKSATLESVDLMSPMPDQKSLSLDTDLGQASTSNSTAIHMASPSPHRLKSSASYITRRLSEIPLPSSTTASSRAPSAADQPGPHATPRDGFIRRATSYLTKSKRDSYSDAHVSQPNISTNRARSNDPVSPASETPFTTSSISSTTPSSSSREGTAEEYEDYAPDEVPFRSATGMSRYSQTEAQPGITWGLNYTDDGLTLNQNLGHRRRSVSHDHLSFNFRKKHRDPDAPVELMATFSHRSMEGAGLKARRLSAALPDDFDVEFSELSKDYVPSGYLPFGRGKTLGKGATAIVKLMQMKGDSSRQLFAVKEYRARDKSEPEDDYVKKVKSEYSIAHSLSHPNIVRSLALCTHHGRWNHVMEYCAFGELYHWVEKGLFKSFFKLSDRNCFFKQLLRGVGHLHTHGIAHRDIKLENLLLTAEGHLKITDFGVSEVFSGEHPGLRGSQGKCGQNMGRIRRCSPGICGSLPYIAPEVLEKRLDYDPRALDVWSCAIVYLTITYSGGPWTEASSKDQMYSRYHKAWQEWYLSNPDGEITDDPSGSPVLPGMFSRKHPSGLTATSSPAMRRLILKMLNPNPIHRIDIHSVLNSAVVKGVECCTPESSDDDGQLLERSLSDTSVKNFKKTIIKKHAHVPPKDTKTPAFLRHRFDMGDGYS